MIPQTTKGLKEEIEYTIGEHEPRARLLEVVVNPIEDKNLYVVTVVFYTVNVENPTTFRVVLERVR
jgi:phage baseplate assembly protein W